jgi:MFS family permease
VAFPLVNDGRIAIALIGVATFMLSLPWGAAIAALIEVVPNALRGRLCALYLFAINVVGLGCGPTLVATLTERVFHSPRAVGAALVIITLAAHSCAVALLVSGLRPFRRMIMTEGS